MYIVIMPKLDLAMDKGVVLEWRRSEGDTIKKDEVLAEIMSEKTTYDLPSPASGTLYRLTVPIEVEVSVGQTIAVITEPGDDPKAVEKAVKKAEEAFRAIREPKLEELKRVVDVRVEKPRKAKRMRISPLARRLAQKHKIDIAKISGTGPGGRIVKDDILRAVEARPPTEPELPERKFHVILLKGVRKVIAERMVYSYRNVPHVTITMELDMSETIKTLQVLKAKSNKDISYNAFFTKAASEALLEYPIVNSTLENNQIKVFEDINIGVAVATQRGLIVPVVPKADTKSLTELTQAIDALAEKARDDRLKIGDVVGGTFTITNLGMFEVEAFTPIITPKQIAILGIGKITERPVIADGEIHMKPIVTLSLSFDHRVLDGAQAAQFLQKVKKFLETTHKS
ncbi:MAG: 2-oxo acid dehydrogenase subunit E2 [Nitrososphaeria archaeon]|nr:2-oxo acid dehydrogenase subunit E2 [Nitrososphaeria archaeon]NIN52438.1 2-oxo acid dehydrogenase subunit E2 [Nitrososphaeria archaeon]NIQ32939.1 2-oxo acid dehydrogenase subunit E2 [Nitrososphaeria archaeon]